MGAVISFFRPNDHRFAGYDRSLEKIDKDLQKTQARLDGLKGRKNAIRTVALVLVLATAAVCAAYIAQLKRNPTLGTWGHFKHVASALTVPLVLVAARELVGLTIDTISRFSVQHIARLKKQRDSLLKQLKDATYYDEIFNIIEKYDPEAKSRSRATAAQGASPGAGAAAGPATAQPHQPSNAAQSPAVLQKGGQAMYHLFQSTGQALSPVMDHLAGLMEDDPMQAAAFRQLLRDQEGLRKEVGRLRAQLIAAGLNPDPVPSTLNPDVAPAAVPDTEHSPGTEADLQAAPKEEESRENSTHSI